MMIANCSPCGSKPNRPPPNKALQRTEASGRLFSVIHFLRRQPPSLSLGRQAATKVRKPPRTPMKPKTWLKARCLVLGSFGIANPSFASFTFAFEGVIRYQLTGNVT